jgi:hypothetical protein
MLGQTLHQQMVLEPFRSVQAAQVLPQTPASAFHTLYWMPLWQQLVCCRYAMLHK